MFLNYYRIYIIFVEMYFSKFIAIIILKNYSSGSKLVESETNKQNTLNIQT